MHALVLNNVPAFWGANVEVVGTVVDDVANWTISQSVVAGLLSGNYKDVNTGALTPFSTSIPAQADGPEDPGGQLDFSQSSSGFGATSLNF
jgi:hypothetical protein